MSSAIPTESTRKGVLDALNEGLTLDRRQVKTLADEFCDGRHLGHVSFALSSGRLEPAELIARVDQQKTRTLGFLFLLSQCIRNGLDVNYYIPVEGIGNTKVHLAAFLATRIYNSNYAQYVYDLLKTSGCSFSAIAYTGAQNRQDETVLQIMEKNSPGAITLTESNFPLEELFTNNKDIVIKWPVFKEILLDQKYSTKGSDVLGFLSTVEVNKRFIMRVIVNYLTARSFSTNCIRMTDDRDLILDEIGNMSIIVRSAIYSENIDYFKVIIDKGSDCDYLCMTELIAQHNDASEKKDRILKDIFGNMIVYAVSTGAEIDSYQLQYLSLHATVELIEEIRTNYREPEWKKLCSRVIPGEKKQIPVKRLRQIAFDLNLDFGLSPTFICDKLEQISNIDRVEFARKSIERQEERVERILMEAGKIREDDPIEKKKCNTKSVIINNPYAYNDARMAFYKDDDGELWCFTSDFFESMIESERNPYTGKKLPLLFLETIKTQHNILKFLDLASPKDSRSMGESVTKIFDNQKEINNKLSEDIYVRGINIIRLVGVRGTSGTLTEYDVREKSLSSKSKIFESFLNLSLYFATNSDNQIESDFAVNNTITRDVGERFASGIVKGSLSSFDNKNKGFKPIDFLFYKSKYVTKVPNSGFNELFFRVVTHHILSFYNKYVKAEDNQGGHFYTDGKQHNELSYYYKEIFS